MPATETWFDRTAVIDMSDVPQKRFTLISLNIKMIYKSHNQIDWKCECYAMVCDGHFRILRMCAACMARQADGRTDGHKSDGQADVKHYQSLF